LIGGDELVVKMVEGVNIDHHAIGLVDASEVVAEEFLGETRDHMNGAFRIALTSRQSQSQ